MLDGLAATIPTPEYRQLPTGSWVWDAGYARPPEQHGPAVFAGLEAAADGCLWLRVAKDEDGIRDKSAGKLTAIANYNQIASASYYASAEQSLLLLLANHIRRTGD